MTYVNQDTCAEPTASAREHEGLSVRNWFPFSDYDFWGYLASGTLLLAGIDYALNHSRLISDASWSAPEIILAVLAIYMSGHVIASLSGFVVEGVIANALLRPPPSVLLGFEHRGPIQSAIAQATIGRYYRPLPLDIRRRILRRAATLLDTGELDATKMDSIFQIAFCKARENEDTRLRVDSFRNQYGFCRNLALSCAVVAVLIFIRHPDDFSTPLGWFLLIVGTVMLIRFLKFYSHFAAEVLRGLALPMEESDGPKDIRR